MGRGRGYFPSSLNERKAYDGRGAGRNLSLTVITLTVCVIYMAVFEYQNQVMFNMTIFDGDPRCHIDTCYLYPNENVVFGILKAKSHISI
jgi:hypothetical protein